MNQNNSQNVNVGNKKEMFNMKNIVATPNNTNIQVISHNKYGNKTFRAFGAYTLVGADGKKQYIPAHLEARGIGTPAIAKIAFNEYVRKQFGATVFFFSRDIKGVREGCYFKEVTDEITPEMEQTTATAPIIESAPVTTPKGIRVLVKGTNAEVFENKEFKLELHNLIMKAQSIGATTIEFNNNGSLGAMFVELGKHLYTGYQSKGLQVYTCIVADGIHDGYFATIDTGSDNKPTPRKEVVPQETPAEVNTDNTTKEVVPTETQVNPNVTENTVNAEVTTVKSSETEEQVSSNTGNTIEVPEVLNATTAESATLGGYCCKKAVTAADFHPEEHSGKTEEEVWELLNGLF